VARWSVAGQEAQLIGMRERARMGSQELSAEHRSRAFSPVPLPSVMSLQSRLATRSAPVHDRPNIATLIP
jgi:hypothetical protein